MTLYGQTQSQNFTLPSAVLDSMIFEVRKGRECSLALVASIEAITALQISEGQKGRLIELQASQLENYRLLDANSEARMQNQTELFMIDRQKQKAKLKKRGRIILGQSVAIVVLVVLILGGS